MQDKVSFLSFQKDNLNVVYSGNLGLTHDIDVLFKGIELLQYRNDISFAIIGGGARQDLIQTKSKLLNKK